MKPQAIEAVQVSEGMAIFCGHLLTGVAPEAAARLAGYARPGEVAQMLMRHPQVRKALSEGSAAMLECEMVPLALSTTREILKDIDPKARAIRAKLALGVLDRAAKNTKDRSQADNPAAELAKLSTAELVELVAKGLAAVDAEANTIDVTPVLVRNVTRAAPESPTILEAWGLGQ